MSSMDTSSKQYWMRPKMEQSQNDSAADVTTPDTLSNEFDSELPVVDELGRGEELSSNRRDFLKVLGFSVSAATLAASCEVPVRKAIPYVVKPEDITPGISTYYASTFLSGSDWCPILVKTREGRPIKIEGNRWSPITKGGVHERALASVLDLYSTHRLRNPKVKRSDSWVDASWGEVDTAISGKVKPGAGTSIAILTSSVASPSLQKAIDTFLGAYPNARHVKYDPISSSANLDAHAAAFGKRVLPSYHFDKAEAVVSIGADYLGSWGIPTMQARGWAEKRRVDKKKTDMSRTWQFESGMSRTGSNADYRIPMKESELSAALLHLYNKVSAKAGAGTISGVPSVSEEANKRLTEAAAELWSNRGKSIVACGLNDLNAQTVTVALNQMLGNYGATMDMDAANLLTQGSDSDLKTLVDDMNGGRVEVLITSGCNPSYNIPGFNAAMSKVGLKVSLAPTMDETASASDFVLPDNHYLESWGDAEAVAGHYNLIQPTITPLFDTRQAGETFLLWATGEKQSYYDFIAANWRSDILAGELNTRSAWTKALQKACYDKAPSVSDNLAGEDGVASGGLLSVESAATALKRVSSSGTEVNIYVMPTIGNGDFTSNPWLLESPDPITKVTWENLCLMNPSEARDQGLSEGDYVTVTANGKSIELPVFHQAGQARGTVSVALGWGRTGTGNEETNSGANAYNLMGGSRTTWVNGTVSAAGGSTKIARTQEYEALFDDSKRKRPFVKEATINEYKANPKAGNEDRDDLMAHLNSFYPDRFANKNGYHWAMAVDLSTCIGCNACHVACQSENNIPVVGKNEVQRMHDMHWIRIDRYYAGSEDNPEVVYQPMMCQHCDQAPCENVCPVAATNHSSEGLNQMAYNRCIGTRYCANNCPYKVRRFNWFDYMGADSFGDFNDKDPMAANGEKGMLSELTRMVLNPDVTVRSRGVMEKCSFCVQRLQEGKLKAKKERRPLRDGEIQTACQAACTTGAITFGNMYDKDSEVYKLSEEDERAFRVIEEFHTLPSVTYLTKIRNKEVADHSHMKRYEGIDNAKTLDKRS